MIVFTANNKEYECPNELKDINFIKYCDYMNLCNSAPKVLVDLINVEEKLLDARNMEEAELTEALKDYDRLKAAISTGKGKKEFTEFKMRVVELFTGLDYETMKGRNGINADALDQLFGIIEDALVIKNSDEKIIDAIDIDNELYYIADSNTMTLGEFLEAAQIEEMNAKMNKGSHEAMIDIAAILLRKEGEEYSDDIYERNKARFATLDMETVSRIAFFFHLKNEQRLKTVLLSLASQELEKLKALRQTALDGISS